MRTKLIKTPLGTDRLEEQRGNGRITRRCTLGYFAVKRKAEGTSSGSYRMAFRVTSGVEPTSYATKKMLSM